jgi:hypothetical protein
VLQQGTRYKPLAQEVSLHSAGRPVAFREHEDYEDVEVDKDVGWLVDFDFTIRYLPTGHGDVFLRRLVDVSRRAAEGGGSEGDLFAALSSPQAPGRCAKCHTIPAAGQEAGPGWRRSMGSATSLHQDGVSATACYAAHRTLGLQAGRVGHNVDDVFNGEVRHSVVHQIGPGAVAAPLL